MNNFKVNGSNAVTETCDNITNVTKGSLLSTWQEANSRIYIIPNETYYNNSYLPRFSHNVLGSNLAAILYQSTCLEKLANDSQRNNPQNPLFAYNDEMLFNIADDKVEACLITNDTKTEALLDYLIERSKEYVVSTEPFEVLIGSFKAQMLSYDCNVTYTKPWNGNQGGNINQIWSQFLDIHEGCNNDSFDDSFDFEFNSTDDSFDFEFNSTTHDRRRLIGVNDDDQTENEAFKILKGVSLFIVSWSWFHM